MRSALRLRAPGRLTPAAANAAVLVLLLTACSSPAVDSGVPALDQVRGLAEAAEQSQSAMSGYFEGTVQEHSVLMKGCLEEAGWKVDLGEDGTYGVGLAGRTHEELDAAHDACKAAVGQVQVTGLSEAQLQERYDSRAEQFECLVEAGWLEGEPKSFEVFVEEYERSGQQELWIPARDVDIEMLVATEARLGPSQLCPLGGAGW